MSFLPSGDTATLDGNQPAGKCPTTESVGTSITATALMPDSATYSRFLSGESATPNGITPRKRLSWAGVSGKYFSKLCPVRAQSPKRSRCCRWSQTRTGPVAARELGLAPPDGRDAFYFFADEKTGFDLVRHFGVAPDTSTPTRRTIPGHWGRPAQALPLVRFYTLRAFL
jgi:hypothetical protein